MHRLFVAIRPPKPVRDLLIDCMDEGPALRWVSDENLHLTLRFIGEVERPQAEDVARQLQRIGAEPFALRISGTGARAERCGRGWSRTRRLRRSPPRWNGRAPPRAWNRSVAPFIRM
jgi:hypothetical protein